MKSYYKQLFSIIILLLLVSCSPKTDQDNSLFIEKNPQTDPTSTPTTAKYTIALVMKTLTNPFFVDMEKGARKAESDFGINLIVKTAAQETSIQQQIEIVEELINDHVDAIVIAPGDSKELIPVLKKAQDAGIIVVNIDNQLDEDFSKQFGLEDVPYISVDNENGSYLSAKFIADQINSPSKAVILEGIQSARNAQDRAEGAKKAFSENENITLAAFVTANWKIDEAYDVVSQLFEINPDIRLIFCSNDMMALGAIQYLDEKHLDNVLVAGFDNLQEAQQAILDDKLQVTIDQQAALQGYTGVEYAIKLLNGEPIPPTTLVDVILVTKDTLTK